MMKKKPKKEKKDDDGSESDEDKKKEVKRPNPVDLLPPSQVVLDSWKRVFMNAENRSEVLDKLFLDIEPGAYSFWKIEYDKLPEEGKEFVSTKNQVSYFLNQVEKARKHSFAIYGVYGTEGNYFSRGMFLLRGTQILQELTDYEGFEYYKKTPLDHTKDQQFIKDYYLNAEAGGVVDGEPVLEVHFFN